MPEWYLKKLPPTFCKRSLFLILKIGVFLSIMVEMWYCQQTHLGNIKKHEKE